MMGEQRIFALVVDRAPFGVTEVDASSSLRDDLGYDGWDIIEMCMEVEGEFDIEITDEDAESLRTVGDLTALVDRLCQGVGA